MTNGGFVLSDLAALWHKFLISRLSLIQALCVSEEIGIFKSTLENLCKRPSLYIAKDESFDIEREYELFAVFVNGMFHGAPLGVTKSWTNWNLWIVGKFPDAEGDKWHGVLYEHFGDAASVLRNLPELYREYEKSFGLNT